MNWIEIAGLISGGTFAGAVIAFATLRATIRKANAEAEMAKAEAQKALAEAERVRIDNTEHATRVLMDNIMKPLISELDATRKDLNSHKREMARLRKAVDSANSCRYAPDCPVIRRVRNNEKSSGPDRTDDGIDLSAEGDDGQREEGAACDPEGDSAGGECEHHAAGARQPP